MYRADVLLVDAIAAVMLIECSGNPTALVGVTSALQSDFPLNPDAEYKELQQVRD